MDKTYAVIGLGVFGRKVCEVLSTKGADVIAIDNTAEQVNRVKDIVSQAVLLDSTDEESLSEASLDSVDAAIVAIGDNIEASILTTALLKQLGVQYIIARSVNKIHYQVLKKVGADEIINIEEDQGTRIALNLVAPSVMEKVQLSKEIILSELYLPQAFVKNSVKEMEFETRFNIRLVAIRRSLNQMDAEGLSLRKEVLLFPEADEKLEEGDILIMVGDESKLESFQKSGSQP
ncbi:MULTISPECIES: TrkA family potassium uptake protein [unclassified Oceanispirochaeta]|uniref:potassium channel family protein n=1 Tax=unclassified Oceanispirochaeta TaxID=2635722 RepID=UPI000E08E1C2|nr:MULTISPECIES: TrkA family potassium uptake protein [unclassified Oceanispirochaeta]MBF9016755.1 TrkA family potassium uptake protein [Oceanispirochaeta sp. M2]NPD72025.1 TrkA family potassium uptake protein [Oceanispirochaeta sp. M1]RDG32469.1 TrkA family potassium uptake protein [Oceanispirochaeta sp. M1]